MRTSYKTVIGVLLLLQAWWVITPVAFTGPLFPMLGALCLSAHTGRHLTRNAILIGLLMGLQVLSVAATIVAYNTIRRRGDIPDVELSLGPWLSGAILFLGTLVYFVWECFSDLNHFAPNGKPDGKGKEEFRCFGCGEAIKQDNEVCSSCGWTWK